MLTFGIKRWSDAQRLQSLELAVDALVVKSWKSKKKKSSITWGALRSGFEKCDWARGFIKALSEFDLPGDDYLVLSPRRTSLASLVPLLGGQTPNGVSMPH